jgi:UDP-glucose 4-epimerase
VALLRVEKLTKQSVEFYEADLGDQKALDHIFSSVRIVNFYFARVEKLMIFI